MVSLRASVVLMKWVHGLLMIEWRAWHSVLLSQHGGAMGRLMPDKGASIPQFIF
jgi:hypothetical protein